MIKIISSSLSLSIALSRSLVSNGLGHVITCAHIHYCMLYFVFCIYIYIYTTCIIHVFSTLDIFHVHETAHWRWMMEFNERDSNRLPTCDLQFPPRRLLASQDHVMTRASASLYPVRRVFATFHISAVSIYSVYGLCILM